MPLIPIIDAATVEKFQDKPKFGSVVFNDDPEQIGRVKVEIPGIFEGEPETLPWIRRKIDTVFCGIDCEIFDVPEEGSIVQVSWDYDQNTPVYSGAPYNKKKKTGEFSKNYKYEAGIKFGDCIIKFDKSTKLVTIENGQAQIVLDTFGDCCIACNNLEVKCDQSATFQAKQIILDANVKVTKGLNVQGAASGLITSTSMACVNGGIVESIRE